MQYLHQRHLWRVHTIILREKYIVWDSTMRLYIADLQKIVSNDVETKRKSIADAGNGCPIGSVNNLVIHITEHTHLGEYCVQNHHAKTIVRKCSSPIYYLIYALRSAMGLWSLGRVKDLVSVWIYLWIIFPDRSEKNSGGCGTLGFRTGFFGSAKWMNRKVFVSLGV